MLINHVRCSSAGKSPDGCRPQLADGQFFLFYDLDVLFGRFHERVVVIYFVRVGDDVKPLRVDYLERFVGTFFKKFVYSVLAFEIYLLFIRGMS